MAVTVITYIAASTQTQGLLAVPCVVGQVGAWGGGVCCLLYMSMRAASWGCFLSSLCLDLTLPSPRPTLFHVPPSLTITPPTINSRSQHQLVQIFVGQPLAHYLADRIKRWKEEHPELPILTTSQLSTAASAADASAGGLPDAAAAAAAGSKDAARVS